MFSAGGTSLDASHGSGAWIGETAWGLPYGSPGTGFQASGGGFSRLFARPAYQDGVPGGGAGRGVPDVSDILTFGHPGTLTGRRARSRRRMLLPTVTSWEAWW